MNTVSARENLLFEMTPAQRALTIVIGNLLLILSAKIQIPFWPVPMTMQTMVVLLLGAFLGAKGAAAAVALYLFEGGLGAPVFAGSPERGVGLAYMQGPTAGYLYGFLVAALVVGWLAERGWTASFWKTVAAMTLGHVLIFIAGVAWLASLIGTQNAIAAGLTPFWAATAAKTAMAVAIVYAAARYRRA